MDLRLLGKNIGIYSLGNIALRSTAFLLIPLYTHYLTVEEYGLLEICIPTIQICIIIMSLGMPQSFIRFYKKYELNNEIGRLFSTAAIINLTTCVIILLCLWIFINSVSNFIFKASHISLVLFISFISIFRSLSELSLSYYRAKNKALTYAIIALSVMIGLILLNLIFVILLKKGIYGVLFSNLIVYFFIALFVYSFIQFKHRSRISFAVSKELISFGFPLIFSMAGWFILHMSSRYFLLHYAGLREVGIYGLGYRITAILQIIVIVPFQLAFGPFVFSHEKHPDIREKISRIFTYLLILLLSFSWGIALFSRNIILIIAPPSYQEAYFVVLLILPAIISNGIYYWAANLLQLAKKTKLIGLFIVSSSILNIFLNMFLVPKYGLYGAVFSTNISIFLAMFLNFVFGLKYNNIKFEKRRLKLIALSFSVLLVCLAISIQFSYLYYYMLNLGLFFLVLVFLYNSNFLFDKEKQYLKNIFLRIFPKIHNNFTI